MKQTMADAENGHEFSFPKTSMDDYREMLLLAFTRRVVLGKAQQFECDFIKRFMCMDLSERNLLRDCIAAYNLTSICNSIEDCDCSGFESLFESWQLDISDDKRLGGE